MKASTKYRSARVEHGHEAMGSLARVRVVAAAVLLVGVSGLSLGVTASSAVAVAPGTVTNYTGTGIRLPARDRGRARRCLVVHQLRRRGQRLDRADHTTGTVTNYTGTGIS